MLLEGAADGETEPVLREVGDYFKRVLYKCDSGEVYMQSKVSGRCVLVVEEDARFRRASVKMPFGPPKSPFDTEAFVFQTDPEGAQPAHVLGDRRDLQGPRLDNLPGPCLQAVGALEGIVASLLDILGRRRRCGGTARPEHR